MKVRELCNRDVIVADPDLSVLDAARRMRQYHVGDLVVVENVEGENEPVGIVTDRDLVLEVLAENVERAHSMRVKDVMTCELVTARERDDAAMVLRLMTSHGVRRIPVVNDRGALEGILTYDDLLEWFVEELGDLVSVVAHQQRVEIERTPVGPP